MRCCVCDWSPTAPSSFNDGLHSGHTFRSLILDRRTDRITCSDCKVSVIEALQDFGEFDYEKQEDRSNPAWLFKKKGVFS